MSAARAPGVVKVWLRAAPEDLDAVAEVLAGFRDADVIETISVDGNHREMTLLLRSRVELAVLRAERGQAVAARDQAMRWLEQAREADQGTSPQDLLTLALVELAFSLPGRVPR